MYRLDRIPLSSLLLLILLVGPFFPAEGQLREVVSSQIAVSRDGASLQLELLPEGSVAISLADGVVRVDDETVGSYSPGDALDTSWRQLLGEVVSLDDGPLARALVDWSPPAEVESDADLRETAGRLDRALETRLSAPAQEATPAADAPPESSPGPSGELLDLLRRADRLAILGEAVAGLELGSDARISVGEDVVVDAGEEIDGSIVVVDGNLDVRGTVRGDVAVTGGRLRLEDGGRIIGDVRLADAGLSRNGGEVEGDVTEVPSVRIRLLEDLDDLENLDDLEDLDDLEVLVDTEELREDLRERIRAELEAEMDDDFWRRYGGSGISSPIRSVGRGLGGLIQDVIAFMVILLAALGVTHLFPRNLARVEQAADEFPGRAALVGLAGVFLLLPVYIVGMIVLAISLVGIPILLVWIPLFPVAAVLAAALGYIAVAILIGRWILRQDYKGLDFLRRGNDLHAAAAGIGTLLIPYAVANILLMGGSWLGALHALFTAAGALAGSIVLIVGFGAVILTRGGRRPLHAAGAGPMGGSGPSTWTEEPGAGPAAGPSDAEWEETWEEDWDQEWEDLERQARRRDSESGEPGSDETPEAGDEGAGTDKGGPSGTGEDGGTTTPDDPGSSDDEGDEPHG